MTRMVREGVANESVLANTTEKRDLHVPRHGIFCEPETHFNSIIELTSSEQHFRAFAVL